MFSGEHGKPFLREAAIEIGVVRDDEHYPVEQIVDGAVINAVTGDHLIGDARNLRYPRRDRKSGIWRTTPRSPGPC
jgi:hypothetical protein